MYNSGSSSCCVVAAPMMDEVRRSWLFWVACIVLVIYYCAMVLCTVLACVLSPASVYFCLRAFRQALRATSTVRMNCNVSFCLSLCGCIALFRYFVMMMVLSSRMNKQHNRQQCGTTVQQQAQHKQTVRTFSFWSSRCGPQTPKVFPRVFCFCRS